MVALPCDCIAWLHREKQHPQPPLLQLEMARGIHALKSWFVGYVLLFHLPLAAQISSSMDMRPMEKGLSISGSCVNSKVKSRADAFPCDISSSTFCSNLVLIIFITKWSTKLIRNHRLRLVFALRLFILNITI